MDTPLPDLPVGVPATIVGITGDAPEHVAMRLRHLGFRTGNTVQVVRVAPLGDPTVYRILGYDMCLRRREADHIQVAVTR
ncbi:ferrous iron transport protein A [Mycobacterium sp. Y57]|uniref:FeoA family protein n=1 Tax=Mycolicibacterium xanthum TaxID=2796469 RepID=UPI001C851BFA|nr:FeoA family protein [Mycolicibacterium xanthum]MBX7435276.1 ferrous iron transport protein A [Mycolicibacterium xanthum]